MQNGKYEGCPVSARGHVRTRPRAFEGPDLLSPAVDALGVVKIELLNFLAMTRRSDSRT
jgi:hypothetical protein